MRTQQDRIEGLLTFMSFMLALILVWLVFDTVITTGYMRLYK